MVTADQIQSRRHGDLVDAALSALSGIPTTLPFDRTVGDELQGLLTEPVSVVDATLTLMRARQWHIGIGVGPVESPLPDRSTAARGPAFVAARAAVERAKLVASHVSVQAEPAGRAEAFDVEVVLRLLAALRERRTPEGWQAVDLMAHGRTQAEVAAELGVSRQAVGQRLTAAHWAVEQDARPVLARLLHRSDAVAAAGGGSPA